VCAQVYKLQIPTPFPVGDVNVFLIVHKDLILIDTGPATEIAHQKLEAHLKKFKFCIEDISHIIFTHWHPDHEGLGYELKKISNATTYAHRLEGSMLENYRLKFDKIIQYYGNEVRKTGLPDTYFSKLEMQYRFTKKFGSDVKIDCKLDEALINISGLNLKILHCPGHTSGSIVIIMDKYMFSGDTLLKDITTNVFFKGRGREEKIGIAIFQNSLKKLADLKITEVFPGHGSNFCTYKDTIKSIFEQHEERQYSILKILRSRSATAFEIVYKLFPNIALQDIPLALAETMGHLEFLFEKKVIKITEKDELVYYHAV
jgi:glyoxylase-like metal-dependent hydrolase (beta-lactamase superfamily II)